MIAGRKGVRVADDTVSNALVLMQLFCHCTPPVLFIMDHTMPYYDVIHHFCT